MANQEHLSIFLQGTKVWNHWRKQYPKVEPDLSHHIFRYEEMEVKDYSGTDFTYTNLNGTYFIGNYNIYLPPSFILRNCVFQYCKFNGAIFNMCILDESNFSGAYISDGGFYNSSIKRARFNGSRLYNTVIGNCDFTGSSFDMATLNVTTVSNTSLAQAYFSDANLHGLNLRKVDLRGTKFYQCKVYGLSTWDVATDTNTVTKDLDISESNSNPILIDDIQMVQFVHLILKNSNISAVIDTLKNKVVLILGRFKEDRKIVLDAVKEKLYHLGYTPVIFDFERPKSADLEETVKTLILLSKFVIIDMTDPSSVPFEMSLVKDVEVPIMPIIQKGHNPWAMFNDLKRKYSWILDVYTYADKETLIENLQKDIVETAEKKAKEIFREKNA